MNLTWRQFDCYLEAFSWFANEHSDQGKVDNSRADLEYMKDDPRLKEIKKQEVERVNALLANIRERENARALQ